MSWSASQYSLFEAERNRPIVDLLTRVATAPVRRAVDLGCGPGNSTEILHDRYPSAEIRGIDSSVEMIEAARARMPGIAFEVADISTWHGDGGYDLILANAALQWVPDHAALLPKLFDQLAPGGSLAVQVPDNLREPTHRLMREIASDAPWASRLAHVLKRWENRQTPDWYFNTLRQLGGTIDLWRTTYFHPLTGGASSIVEWVRGSALSPFLEVLTDIETALFLERYEAAIAGAYSTTMDGVALLPFPRLFWVVTK